MVIVGKHINGITINPFEHLLDGDNGEPIEFVNEEAAKTFLKEKGFSDDDLYWLVFETVDTSHGEVNRELPLVEVIRNGSPDCQIVLDLLTKRQFMETYSGINYNNLLLSSSS